jgi:hypothetical protein
MESKRSSLFGSTRALENELDEFLDAVSEAGLIFQKGVSAFLTRQDDQLTDKVAQLGELERRGDANAVISEIQQQLRQLDVSLVSP